ncbi:MAG: T9SS type A sorting domain-containing protein [Candidatus Muirbacterium halophilum]|nr:T9SS type A sorting domain-containing protein [Candidatus Muirbacterium halophilum]
MKRILIFSIYILYICSFCWSTVDPSRLLFERNFVQGYDFVPATTKKAVSLNQTVKFKVLNPANSYREANGKCVYIGTNCYVFIEEGLDTFEVKINRMVDTFERISGIRNRLNSRFGTEWLLNGGVDSDEKMYIFICDMGDFSSVNYGDFIDNSNYGPNGDTTFPIDGYYSILDQVSKLVYPLSNEKEIIFLNKNLLKFAPIDDSSFNPLHTILAREYFRMIINYEGFIKPNSNSSIPNDNFSPEDVWVEYGLAMYAEKFATGFLDSRYLTSIGQNTSNSLVFFDKSFSDYSINEADIASAGLFFMYMEEQLQQNATGDILAQITKESQNGVTGIKKVLQAITTADFEKVVDNYFNALYLDNKITGTVTRILAADFFATIDNIDINKQKNNILETIEVSPSIKVNNIPKLRMGGGIGIKINEKFWPNKYLHCNFPELTVEDKIKASIHIFNKENYVKTDTFEINSTNSSFVWNNLYDESDNIYVILTDLSNSLQKTGKYKFPYYPVGTSKADTQETYANSLKEFYNKVGKNIEISIINPENPKFTIYPSPFIPDYLHFNIVAEGNVVLTLKKPSDNLETVSLIKIANKNNRFAGSLKLIEDGEYTAELKVSYIDRPDYIKNYKFSVIDYINGKNIILDNINYKAVVLRSSSVKDSKFLISDEKDEVTVDTMSQCIFESEIVFLNENKAGIYKKDADSVKLLPYEIVDNHIVAKINAPGTYMRIVDTQAPEIIDIEDLDGKLEFKVNDISLKNVIVKNEKGEVIFRSSQKNNILHYADNLKEIFIEAEDNLANKNTVQLKIGNKAPAILDYVKVYPNPASEFAVFELSSSSNNIQIKIYNTSGKLVKKADSYSISTNGSKHYYTWLLEDKKMKEVSNGIYFYKVFVNGEEKTTGKIAVIR